MKTSLFALLFFVTLPSAAHAIIEVALSREAKTPHFATRTVDGKPCVRGYVASVDLKSLGSEKALHNKAAVMELRSLGGIGRDRNVLLARVFFRGDDRTAGLSMSHLIYRNGGVSAPIEVCENGDIRITHRP